MATALDPAAQVTPFASEYIARSTTICGGVEPAIAGGELKPGESAQGWVTFQAPNNFAPAKFMFYASGATIGFTLR